jgi:hypothetical protein
MSAPVVKDKTHTPLRTVKVKASASPKQSSGSNSNRPHTTRSVSEKIPIEDMVSKGLDLAEVGIGLGVNIVARLGSILKDQVFDKFNGADMLSSVMSNMTAEQQPAAPQQNTVQAATSNGEAQQSTEQNYYLFNRLPLRPGDSFSLSFSVNNDSLSLEKTIKLALEPFVGETHGQQIAAEHLVITPSETVIAVVDFEKFVLSGRVAANLPADTYHGWVIVTAEQTYRIPVVLNVSAAQQYPTADAKTDTNESLTE